MVCLLLSPVLQFGNSGGPLVNLVSSPACSLAVRGRGVPRALQSVRPGAQCPGWEHLWVLQLLGGRDCACTRLLVRRSRGSAQWGSPLQPLFQGA